MTYYGIYKITNLLNGKISIMAYECPEGFVAGRLPFNKKEEIS